MEVVALCNVDESEPHLGWAAEKFPKAQKFSDFRRLMDKADTVRRGQRFDARPHARADRPGGDALGKHVFCQKPLTHTVHEARRMRDAAEKQGVVTQMGNQIQSNHAYRNAVKLVHDGAIGKVREVHSWQAGGMEWLRTAARRRGADPVPKSLDWDLWLGVAPRATVQKGSLPSVELASLAGFQQRPTWRLRLPHSRPGIHGTGADVADDDRGRCRRRSTTILGHRGARSSINFPERRARLARRSPSLGTTGRSTCRRPEQLGLDAKYELPAPGSAFLGEKGTMILPHWADPSLFPAEKFADYKMPMLEDVDHYTSWAHACLDRRENDVKFRLRRPADRGRASGTVAIRFPKEQLSWDAKAGQFTHHADANARLTKEYRKGWSLS